MYRLGGFVPLDGRVSWAPHLPGRAQPINSYVILDNPRPILIDSGMAVHRSSVVRGAELLLGDQPAATAFLTRAELDCAGNVRDIHRVAPLAGLITGGTANPFDQFDIVAGWADVFNHRQVLAQAPGEVTKMGDSQSVEILPPPVRVLATYWVYDDRARTLFTSDFFGYTDVSECDPCVVLDGTTSSLDEETARRHLLAKFGWLALADTTPLVDSLRTVVRGREIEVLAPTHGCVLRGAEMVQRHVEFAIRLLRSVGVQHA